MSKISAEEVKKVVRLAALRTDQAGVEKLQAEFEKILSHFASLGEVNLEGVQPLYHLVDENHMRSDETESETLDRKNLLSNAPDQDERHFRLGRILGGAE